MSALGSTDGKSTFLLLIDTGDVLTSRDFAPAPRVQDGNLVLYDQPLAGAVSVPRVEFDDVKIYFGPLHDVGIGAAMQSIGGILGGDLLQRFSLGLDYGKPEISLLPGALDCSCQLADSCNAVFNFTLAGGGAVALGDQVYAYPATRVTFDACLEPARDPTTDVPCRTGAGFGPGYEVDQPPGVDVRLLVATGFGGMLLGASAWDRLRGAGTAAPLLAGPTVALYFAGSATPVRAARVTLGMPGCQHPPCDSIALVGREGLIGACQELARSRRLRWSALNPGGATGPAPDCNRSDSDCPDPKSGCLQCLSSSTCPDPNGCNDVNHAAAAFIELSDPIDVYLVDDTAPILMEVNADVQPLLSVVEGVVGTDLISRLALRIDYPNRRMIAQCASGSGCTTFPRYACKDRVGDCGPRGGDAEGLCNPPRSLNEMRAGATGVGASRCLPAKSP